MPTTMKELRLQAGFTAFQLAVEAKVSLSTINRLEAGKVAVSRLKAYKVIKALSETLEREIKPDDITGLNIREQ